MQYATPRFIKQITMNGPLKDLVFGLGNLGKSYL